MDFKTIRLIAKEYPALARLLEASFAALLAYMLGTIVGDGEFSKSAAVTAFVMPLYMAVSKKNRDIKKGLNG